MGIVRNIVVQDVLVHVQDVVLAIVKEHVGTLVVMPVPEAVQDTAIILAVVDVEVLPTKIETKQSKVHQFR